MSKRNRSNRNAPFADIKEPLKPFNSNGQRPGSRPVNQLEETPLFGDYDGTGLDNVLGQFNKTDLLNVPGITRGLDSILQGYGKISTSERTDMLLQYILQMISTNDQRAYDKNVLGEQRIYDSPTNQLARLMGAGISRDAAIQLLSGASGGSGAALVGSGSGVSVPSVSAPSGTGEIERSNMIINAVASLANTLVNLASQGMQMAQAYETYQFQKNQTYMSQQQVDDYNAVNTINQQLQILSDSGVLGSKKIEEFRSVNDLTKYLNTLDSPDVKQLINSDAYKRSVGTIYGREYLNNIMQSRRTSQDAGKVADMAITQQELSNNLLSLNQEKLSEDINKLRNENILLDAEYIKTMQDIAESSARIQYMNKQGKWIDVQIKQGELNYEITSTGLPIMKENRIHELRMQAIKWRSMFNPSEVYNLTKDEKTGLPNIALSAAVDAWLKNPQNAADLAYLQSLHNGALAGFAQQHPSLWKLCCVLNDLGVLDMVKTAGEVGGAALLLGL